MGGETIINVLIALNLLPWSTTEEFPSTVVQRMHIFIAKGQGRREYVRAKGSRESGAKGSRESQGSMLQARANECAMLTRSSVGSNGSNRRGAVMLASLTCTPMDEECR